ncbi:CDP-glycerol glycerophosphotransferase family protein [Alkalihalobacillus sp. AL-G]|uniref:CDP-glycerol glycerophosphotransferase family protein n=1 Tax=Alkalihalobacillus sp. AL-G TaxID=2926399 RepID=UPI00272A6CF7|nr:CDP-glycerol glycerophosphotransferase family protein [Alkalihalobacillus sp. AL-G]WLD92899.1 CDP-glycerol glycerophosphotransferase family protein [Alkalihalobacillus sp. AL-G]
MVRELAIFLFLLLFKCVFFLFSLLPLREKTTFVVSLGDNSKYVLDEMQRQNIQIPVVVLCKKNSMSLFKDYKGIDLFPFQTSNIFHWSWLKSIYHLATSLYIMVDNYYGFLAAVHFKKGVQCIQLWHASGTLKKFGLEDGSIKYRSPKAKKRFLQVYSNFGKVVVGSDVMAAIFIKSFNLKKEQILTTGIPRTDFFFNEKAVQNARRKFALQHPEKRNKKVILYAPTYRDHELDHFELKLDIGKMAEKLGDDYVLFLRLHPAIQNTTILTEQYSDFIVDVFSGQYDLNELLVAADYLITDYSSIVVEFSILQKPMIFFTYDFEEYKRSRGVIEEFEKNLPGPIVRDTDSIIELIHSNDFDLDAIKSYSETWNKYSKGRSSYQLVQYMFPEKSMKERISYFR